MSLDNVTRRDRRARRAGASHSAPRRMSRTLLLGMVACLLAPASAVAASLHPKLLAEASYGAVTPSFARTADGTLHVAYETNTNWGDSANGIGVRSISPSGVVEPPVQALAWNAGPSNGIPGLAVMPGGSLEAVFIGSPGGDPGPWGISSTNGGSSWTGPVDIGSGSMEGGGGMTLQTSNGTPVLTEGCCGGLVVQQGFGAGTPTNQVVNSTDGVAGNVDSAVDAATGAVIASWDSAASPGGLWFQEVAPSQGTPIKLPVPVQYGTGEPLPVAGRDNGPGVFAAYPSNYGSTTHIRLARYGGGSLAVGSVKGLHADAWGTATGPDGRIWVFWFGTLGNGTAITAVTRSNKAVTRFEPIQQYRFTWSGGITLSGDGRLGPLDMLIGGTPFEKVCCGVTGIYYGRVLPELSASVSATDLGGGKFGLKVKVTDAGDPLSGATASAKGTSGKTAKGKVKLKVSGVRGDRVMVKILAPGYQVLRARLTL